MNLSEERQKLIVLIVVGLLYSASLAYFFQGLPRARLTSDFFPRWHASNKLLTTGRSIYDWANAAEVSEVTGWPYLNQLGYYYPAYMLIFTAPLALLPYPVAHFVWVMFGLWCLWLGMAIFARRLEPGLSVGQLTLLLALFTTAVPVFQHTLYAQFNSIAALSLALIYVSLRRRRYLLAGVFAGGLLFKPQATLLPLIFLLLWSALRRERRRFWPGLALVSVGLWAIAELLEPNWVVSFLQSLESYVPINSAIDILFWNPYQFISLALAGLALWLIYRHRATPPEQPAFAGLLAFTICVNAVIIPMFGMLHIVFMGPALVMALNSYQAAYPAYARWLWGGVISLFVAGWLAFILPLLLTESTGLQITAAEWVYRFTLPLALGAVSLPLITGLPVLRDFRESRQVP